jgi:hypothetical protein
VEEVAPLGAAVGHRRRHRSWRRRGLTAVEEALLAGGRFRHRLADRLMAGGSEERHGCGWWFGILIW